MTKYRNMEAMIDQTSQETENFAHAELLKEEMQEVLDKAQAFDKVLISFDESISESHMADDVIGIVNEYRKGISQ